MTPRCGLQARTGEPFCHECRRIVSDDERWALRMAYRSPAYDRSLWAGESGMNILWVLERTEGPPASTSEKNLERAVRILHYVEWTLVAQAIGRRIYRVKLRRAAKSRGERMKRLRRS